MNNSGNVTYETFLNKKVVQNFKNTSCFSSLYFYKFDTIKLLLETSKLTEKYKNFWLKLVKQIEPSVKISRDRKYITVNYLGSKGKTLFLLSIIRYLWEGSRHYDHIVIMTYNILEKYPNLDPLSAIVIASSNTSKCDGFGHGVVSNGFASYIPTINDYVEYSSDRVFTLCGDTSYNNPLSAIRKLKSDDFDIDPIINHFQDRINEILNNNEL